MLLNSSFTKPPNVNWSLSVIQLFMFWMGVIHTDKRLSPLTPLLPRQHAHTSVTIRAYVHRWYCYLPVGVHCKPLRHGELYSLYSLAPLSQQGGPGEPRWKAHTQLKQQLVIVLNFLSILSVFPFCFLGEKKQPVCWQWQWPTSIKRVRHVAWRQANKSFNERS